MKNLSELLKRAEKGLTLTPDEQAYLKKYKDLKLVRHSGSFIHHARKLPKE